MEKMPSFSKEHLIALGLSGFIYTFCGIQNARMHLKAEQLNEGDRTKGNFLSNF